MPDEEKKKDEEKTQESAAAIEELAKEMGWNPDFKGLDREKIDARAYILKSRTIQDTMRKHLRENKGQIEQLGDQVTSGFKRFEEHQVKVHKAEVVNLNSQIAVLKKDRRAAVKDGDGELLDELDEQIDVLKVAAKAPPPAAATETASRVPRPEFVDWTEKNTWYQGSGDVDKEMTEYTDNLYQENTGLPLGRLLVHIDKMMREHYPERFETKKETAVSEKTETLKAAVAEVGETKTKPKGKHTRSDLTDDQRKNADEFIALGKAQDPPYTMEKYIEGLEAIGAFS